MRAVPHPGRHDLVVLPPAELDEHTAPRFAEHLRAVEGDTDIVIDLRQLGFCGSAGIRALLEIEHHAHEHGCTLTLSCPPAMFERVLDACGLGDHFTIRRPASPGRWSGGGEAMTPVG